MIKTNVLKFKKAVAVFMAMLLMMLSFSYTANDNSDAANSSMSYKVYNATTGHYLREYTLAPLETDNNDNTRSIIDDDDRVVDWTKSGVTKIINADGSFGSGFVVDEHTIATAAHCLYNCSNTTTRNISKILLFDTSGNIEQNIIPVEYHLPIKFINAVSNKEYSTISDYALITVEEDLSEYMCFELGVPLDSFVNGNATVTTTGFPEKVNKKIVNTCIKHMKYSGNGKVCGGNTENTLLYYKADASEGNSGGPVYITESLNGRTYYTVVAINVAQSNNNIGTRMTTDLIHFYKSNNNLRY